MAETTLLRQSAIVRNASVGTSPPLSPPGAVKTGELPLVQVKTTPAAPQFLVPQAKPVEILPPRDAGSALRTGGLPMISVKMTSQGPQLDDGQDKPVVILPPRGQKHAVAAGGLPMVDVKMTSAGPQIQNLPTAQKAPPQIQGPQPPVSQPRRSWGAAPPVNKGRVVRVAAPKIEVPLPPLPEFTAEQLMLCRHLVGKYLGDLSAMGSPGQGTVESAVGSPGQGTVEPVVGTAQDSGDSAETAGNTDGTAGAAPEGLIHLVEATIEMIDQALVAVAVRAEAAEIAAAAAAAAAVAASVAVPVQAPAIMPAPVGTSIIPAAPSASYVAGRVGGRPNGYVRAQRSAPRRVAHGGELPMVQVKMDGGRAVVQNQQEVAAARAARVAQPSFASEVGPELDGILPG
jgi:hypothetical protein